MTLTTADTSSSIEREMERLFPLPLTMMEAFMLADATPDYPMMCDVEMQFTGRIERRAFDEAVAVAMRRAPIFRSVVERDAKGRPQWSLTDRTPLVDWRPWGAPFGEEYDTLIDIERELPMRLYVREGAERSTVVMHLHHSGADGLGCFAFAEDFLAAYANASSPAPVVELRPFDPARLLTRGVASIAPSKGWQVVVDGWIGLREAIRFFWQRPQPLAPRSSVGANDASQLRPCAQRQQVGYIYQTCPDDVAAGLRSLAAERQVTLNGC